MLERMVQEQLDLARELHQRDHYNDPDQLERMRLEHQAISAATTARDAAAAKELVRRHLTRTSALLTLPDGSSAEARMIVPGT